MSIEIRYYMEFTNTIEAPWLPNPERQKKSG